MMRAMIARYIQCSSGDAIDMNGVSQRGDKYKRLCKSAGSTDMKLWMGDGQRLEINKACQMTPTDNMPSTKFVDCRVSGKLK